MPSGYRLQVRDCRDQRRLVQLNQEDQIISELNLIGIVEADGPFVVSAPGFDPIELPAGEWLFYRSGDGLVIVGPGSSVYDSPLFRHPRFVPR